MDKRHFSLPPNNKLRNNFLVKMLQAITGCSLSGYSLYFANALGAALYFSILMSGVMFIGDYVSGIYFDYERTTLIEHIANAVNWFIYMLILWSVLEFLSLVFPFFIKWALTYHAVKIITFAIVVSIVGLVLCILLLVKGIPSSWFYAN
ncbi:hypothetical protein [Agaribacter marinus]|uniref:Uncharacterized protein n=1 Tax=Agaribacter marinus TaxID=1431249 RepID=A0AA37WIE0_9ALTE|nr:hypothetical protein [Agaribacter marinus]GLR70787.1 hypothetical protein GCM10007852_16950 [Agaribacter marinus]